VQLCSYAHADSDRMATAFAPRMSMPGTPRGNGTTPRSARRLQSTPSSRLSLGGNSLGAVHHAAAALAPLPPINTRTYPERSYADDDELRDLMERDKVAVDDAVSILGHALASTRKRLVESLEEIAAEHKRLERLTRELGDAAKDMVKTVQREKDEMDKAKSLENEVQTRARSLAVQVETANGEVKEIQARLQARRERALLFFFASSRDDDGLCSVYSSERHLGPQSKRNSAPHLRTKSPATDPNSPFSNRNSASRSAAKLVRFPLITCVYRYGRTLL
jgi:archaellum component FlaC